MQFDRERISYIIGERIREFRVLRGMSQEALAFASEINPTYLGRLERGEKCPTVDTLYKISLGLKLPLHELLDLLDVSAALEPSQTEAMHRIQTAMEGLSESDAVDVAEIVEKLIAFKKSNP